MKFILLVSALLFTSLNSFSAVGISPELQQYINEQIELKADQIVHKKLEALGLTEDQLTNTVGNASIKWQKTQQLAAQQKKQLQEQLRAKLAKKVDVEKDHVRGDKHAEFTLLEYSDYECPYCKRFHDTAKLFMQRNPDVNWVYRHFPLGFHDPLASKQAQASECAADIAGNDAFWSYTDLLYTRTTSNGNGMKLSDLVPWASELGVNTKKMQSCMDTNTFADKVRADFSDGSKAGISGTPGNFLIHNPTGELMVVTGAQPLVSLEAALKQLKDRVNK
jgi:protein-disulfide isomerase